jgi:ABC-type transport system involved in cytochrome c biogenesis permease component
MSLAVLLRKDLQVELRSRDMLAATLTVALLVALVGNVAYAQRVEPLLAVPGTLWIGIIFGAEVGLARTFVVERERSTLEGILASPAAPLAVFVSKLLVATLVVLLIAGVSLVALAIFFRIDPATLPLALLPVVALGVLGVCLALTLAAGIAMHGRNWVLLVPLLSLPILFPVVAAAVPATGILLAGAPLSAVYPHLLVLAAFDVVFLTAAWIFAPLLLEP